MVDVGLPSAEKIKMITATAAACITFITGYITLDGPLPATRQWVVAQSEQLRTRLIDNSLEVNRLELELLRREQFDRKLQSDNESRPEVKQIYQERLNNIADTITNTINKNLELQHERQSFTTVR